jgi:hypothetical protein
MLLEKESKVLEKLKVMSVAVDYALKAGRVWDSNLYHGGMYNCPPIKDVLDFMETFHTLDAFVYGSCDESGLFGCDPANHWTIQVGYSESAPKAWEGDDKSGYCEAYAVVTYNRNGERCVRIFGIPETIATVYARLFFTTRLDGSPFDVGFHSSNGIVTEV